MGSGQEIERGECGVFVKEDRADYASNRLETDLDAEAKVFKSLLCKQITERMDNPFSGKIVCLPVIPQLRDQLNPCDNRKAKQWNASGVLSTNKLTLALLQTEK